MSERASTTPRVIHTDLRPAAFSGRPLERTPRFTLDGDVGLERHLAQTCHRIAAGIRGLVPASKLEGLVLGGGYGRGEGGVLHTQDGDRPYNDLEFYVFLHGSRHLNEQRYGRALHVLGEILTPQAGIDVEFRIASRHEFAAGDVSMFSYDLINGHRWLIGDETLFAGCDHHRSGADIPVTEATRLLMNRCTGLLLALDRLERAEFTPADADFVARNVAKAQLGAGDAVLTAYGQYHWSVRERQRRLERLARTNAAARWLADVARHHADGVEFKLHPIRSTASRAALMADHVHVSDFCREVWLWLENRRLKGRFRSIRDYVQHPGSKWPEALGPRSAVVNARLFGAGAAKHHLFRHPRERALNTLPLLLWQRDALAVAVYQELLQRELNTRARDVTGFLAAYRRIWERVN